MKAKKYLVLRKCYHNKLHRANQIVDGAELTEPIPRHFLPLDTNKPLEVAIEDAKSKLAKGEKEHRAKGEEGAYNPNTAVKSSKSKAKTEEPPEK